MTAPEMGDAVLNIRTSTLNNIAFRDVFKTTQYAQYVLMSLRPGEEIGMEIHPHTDQFIRVEAGKGVLYLGNLGYELDDDTAAVIPAGTRHNVVNTSDTDYLKLYSIYSPPQHPPGTFQLVKQEEIE